MGFWKRLESKADAFSQGVMLVLFPKILELPISSTKHALT
jgi:hypothetical protein